MRSRQSTQGRKPPCQGGANTKVPPRSSLTSPDDGTARSARGTGTHDRGRFPFCAIDGAPEIDAAYARSSPASTSLDGQIAVLDIRGRLAPNVVNSAREVLDFDAFYRARCSVRE